MSIKNWFKFIALGLLWGSSFLWIKIAVQEIGPLTLVSFRVGFAVLGLLVYLVFHRAHLPGWRTWHIFFILGLISVAIPFALISWSEQHITSGMASILNSTVPLFTILFAHFFVPDDRLNLPKVFGLIVGFVGVVILLSNQLQGEFTLYNMGQFTMLLAAMFYGMGAVYARLNTKGLTPDIQAFGQQFMSWVIIMPAALMLEAPYTIPQIPITWVALAWLGLLGTATAYLIYFSLLHTVGPTRTMLVTYVFPLVGVILGIIFLQEKISWNFIVGGALIISGIVLVNSKLSFQKKKMKVLQN